MKNFKIFYNFLKIKIKKIYNFFNSLIKKVFNFLNRTESPIDMVDIFLLSGISFIFYGISLLNIPVAFIVAGSLIFITGLITLYVNYQQNKTTLKEGFVRK